MLQILADSLMVATRLEPTAPRQAQGRGAADLRRWRWLGWFGLG